MFYDSKEANACMLGSSIASNRKQTNTASQHKQRKHKRAKEAQEYKRAL